MAQSQNFSNQEIQQKKTFQAHRTTVWVLKRIDFNLRPIATTLPLSALPANDDNADDDADDNGVYDDDDAADDDSDDDDFVQVQSDKHEPVFLGSPCLMMIIMIMVFRTCT